MNHNYPAFSVIYPTNDEKGKDRAIFLDFERANTFAIKKHGIIMGLVEIPLDAHSDVGMAIKIVKNG